MKKAIKKLLVSALTLAFIIPSVAFAQEETTVPPFDFDEAYQWALEIGVTEAYLEGISEDALSEIYYDNFGAEKLIVQEDVTPLVLSEESGSRGAISEADMNFKRSHFIHYGSDDRIELVNIYFTGQWLNGRPYQRFEDAMAINWDEDLFHIRH